MCLAAGEVVQELIERLGRHDPQIHLHPATLYKDLRRPVRQDLVHERGRGEGVGQGLLLPARRHEVQVADGLFLAPEGARDLRPFAGRVRAEKAEQVLGEGGGLVEEHAALAFVVGAGGA